MTARNYSSTTPVSVLTAGIGPGDLSMTLSSSASSFPPPPFTMLLSPDTANEEVVDVTAASGSVFTITRGVDGTAAKTHASGSQAIHGVSARDFQEANDFINNPPSGVKFQDTAPTSPQDGEVWIDSDSSVVTVDPSNFVLASTAPGKELAYATNSTLAMLSSTNSTLMSVTFDAPGVPIIVSMGFSVSMAYWTSTSTDAIFDLFTSSGTSLAAPVARAFASEYSMGYENLNLGMPICVQARIQPTAGSVTLQLRGRNVGSGDVEFNPSGYPPAWIRVTRA